MNKKLFVFFLGMLLLFSSLAARPVFYFNTGMSKPFAPEEFKQYWRAGYNIGAGVGFPLSERFELQGVLFYDNLALDDTRYIDKITDKTAYASVTDGDTHIGSLWANAKLFIPSEQNDKVTPFLTGGVCIANRLIAEKEIFTEQKTFTEEKQSDMVPGAGIGLGFDIEMGSGTLLNIQVRMHALFTDDISIYAPVTLGVKIK